MKYIWKLKSSAYGFALLDVATPLVLVVLDFLTPFTRFYLEGYLQTVLTTKLGPMVYKGLVKDIHHKEISNNFDYQMLSTFFEMSAKLGGVRLSFCLFVYVCMCVCTCVCVCALTAAHLWGHSYEYTPAKWGLFKLWGHFRVPAKKSS